MTSSGGNAFATLQDCGPAPAWHPPPQARRSTPEAAVRTPQVRTSVAWGPGHRLLPQCRAAEGRTRAAVARHARSLARVPPPRVGPGHVPGLMPDAQ